MADDEAPQAREDIQVGCGKKNNGPADPQSKLHRLIFESTKSLAGYSDPKGFCSSLALALHQAVEFDALALMLVNPRTNYLLYPIFREGIEGEYPPGIASSAS
jgi:hypothetical protein